MASGSTQYPIDVVIEALDELFTEEPIVTTQDIAEEIGCGTETARVKLWELVDEGVLRTRQVGAAARIWYPLQESFKIDSSAESVPKQISSEEESAPKQIQERVMFFPSRREIAVDTPSEYTREVLSRTAHLIDSRGDGYLYKITREDVWNAPYNSFDGLREDLKTVIGENWDGGFESRIRDDWERAHQFRLRTHVDENTRYTVLEAEDARVFKNVAKAKLEYNTHYTQFLSDTLMRIKQGGEAGVKEILYEEGYPVIDERYLEEGAELAIELDEEFDLRNYQQTWVEQFEQRRAGVFVGPSGSGKTIAAIGTMEAVGGETLIIVPSRELAQQWEEELLEKTNLGTSQIGQYHGGEKNIRPVTIATYDTAAMSRHRELFNERAWGLIIADECHHAVASTWKRFREIQSTARLGLSATPVRESGDAKEIYTLIGPPIGTDWSQLFEDGWVSKPDVEIKLVPWGSDKAQQRYQKAEGTNKLIEAARNPAKPWAIRHILDEHETEKTLIFVDWIEQGKELADKLGIPFIHGETNHDDRESIYQQFRQSKIETLIVSRVGDEGIDLPNAEVAILASTMGSSKSQTGQRAGRTMRPLGDAQVYILLTKGTGEEDWGRESTQYLAEKAIDVTKKELSLSIE